MRLDPKDCNLVELGVLEALGLLKMEPWLAPKVPTGFVDECAFDDGPVGDELSGDVGEKARPSTRVCSPDILDGQISECVFSVEE